MKILLEADLRYKMDPNTKGDTSGETQVIMQMMLITEGKRFGEHVVVKTYYPHNSEVHPKSETYFMNREKAEDFFHSIVNYHLETGFKFSRQSIWEML